MLYTNNFVVTSVCNNLLKNSKQHGGDKCALRLDYLKCAFQFAKSSLTMIVYNPHFFAFQVDFVSTTVKKYEIALVVDVDGVGEEILSLPIIAKLVHLTLYNPWSLAQSNG